MGDMDRLIFLGMDLMPTSGTIPATRGPDSAAVCACGRREMPLFPSLSEWKRQSAPLP
jgi:hypothetical protein